MKLQGLGLSALALGLLISMSPAAGLESQNKPIEQILQKAHLKVIEGDKAGAIALYHRALQMDSNQQEARHKLGALLVDAYVESPYEEEVEAMHGIHNNLREPVNAPVNFSLSYLDNGALSSYDEAMSQRVLLALQKLRNNDNKAALLLAQTLSKQYPSHPVPYNLLGLAWQGLGNPTKARESFQKAIALRANFHAARINLAELELNLGEFGVAHQELDTVLKANAHHRRAALVKAQLYNIEGHPDLSRAWYSKVSENL